MFCVCVLFSKELVNYKLNKPDKHEPFSSVAVTKRCESQFCLAFSSLMLKGGPYFSHKSYTQLQRSNFFVFPSQFPIWRKKFLCSVLVLLHRQVSFFLCYALFYFLLLFNFLIVLMEIVLFLVLGICSSVN